MFWFALGAFIVSAGYIYAALTKHSPQCDLCDDGGYIYDDGVVIGCPNCNNEEI